MQSDTDKSLISPGGSISLTSLTTNKYVQLNAQTKQLDAMGSYEALWEVLPAQHRNEKDCIQLRHIASKAFIHMADDFLVDLTSRADVSCDMKVHYHSMDNCVSLEFVAYPNCFVGFKKSGEPKTTTIATRSDIFSVENKGEEMAKVSGNWSKPRLNHVPVYHPLPGGEFEPESFNQICLKRVDEFNSCYREIQIRYLGVVALTIEDSTHLDISKEGRKVYTILSTKLGCFGNNSDTVRIEALGKYPQIEFEKVEYYIPVFQATGKVIGRQVTEIELDIFRQRPKWLDRKESSGIIRLAPLIPENVPHISMVEQIHLQCCKTQQKKGSLFIHLHFTQYKYL